MFLSLYRHSHKVTVWGKLAISTDAEFSEAAEKPLIAILASTKLKIFKSMSNLDIFLYGPAYISLF